MKIKNREEFLDRHPKIKKVKKIFRILAGFTLLIIGVLAYPLPIPGLMVMIFLGLILLSTQYLWARHLIKKVKDVIKREKNWVQSIE